MTPTLNPAKLDSYDEFKRVANELFAEYVNQTMRAESNPRYSRILQSKPPSKWTVAREFTKNIQTLDEVCFMKTGKHIINDSVEIPSLIP